jgi:formylmethanofuran dehydrogenase subunit B
MTNSTRVEHVTCLGCGCGCDDISVTVSDKRITDVSPACPVGRAWFGDGIVPSEVRRTGRPSSLDEALADAADVLVRARNKVLVYIAPELTSQAQRLAVALADILGAKVETATTSSAAEGLLAAQRRGRAGATLGELRNRADVVLFWGFDPNPRYPRFMARYVEPGGTQVAEGRKSRTIIGVSVGADPGPKAADLHIMLEPEEEIPALTMMRASVQGYAPDQPAGAVSQALTVGERLMKARYAVLVYDAEPEANARNALRAEALMALAQALNGPTRAAAIGLRAGGNRVGIESVLTWQTGYPFSIDFSRGYPRYEPSARGARRADQFEAALVLGSPEIRSGMSDILTRTSTVVIGPRASEATFDPRVAIDTGVAGIHEGGTAYRTDEVPLRLRPPLEGSRTATDTLLQLLAAVRTRFDDRQ